MPPRRRTDGDDFAPGGSEVTRQGPERREVLPPGRLNRETPPPNPRRAAVRPRKVTDPKPPAEPAKEALTEALSRVAEARRAPRGGRMVPIAPVPEPEPEPVYEEPGVFDDAPASILGIPDAELPGMIDASTAVSAEVTVQEGLELAKEALMYALRLRLFGEGEAGDWERFDQVALNALSYGDPDPREQMTPVQRFLYGDTGYFAIPEMVSSADEVLDVINLGQAE